jgi:HEAT repeat protein
MGLFDGLLKPNVEKLERNKDIESLIKALNYQTDSHVRENAAKALGNIGDPKSIEPLIAALKDDEFNVRKNAAEALGKMGTPAVKPLIAALKSLDDEVRYNAVRALGDIGDPSAIDSLNSAMRDSNDGVCKSAAIALSKVEDRRAFALLIAAVKDPNNVVRKCAGDALVTSFYSGRLGQQEKNLILENKSNISEATHNDYSNSRDGCSHSDDAWNYLKK